MQRRTMNQKKEEKARTLVILKIKLEKQSLQLTREKCIVVVIHNNVQFISVHINAHWVFRKLYDIFNHV